MARFLVIEGLIGVGKTSLCRILRQAWNARLILEPADDNPFLANFYDDPARFGFPTQMFYLATRYQQQQELRQLDLFSPLVISDYLFAKDALFAEMTLRAHELALYQRFASLLPDRPPTPDVVLFLDAATPVIQERIRRRGLGHERAIPDAYLDELRSRYLALWSTYDEAPVHHVRTDDIDYVNNLDDRARMMAWIKDLLHGPARAPALFTQA